MRRLSFLLLAISVFTASAAQGAVTDEDIALLREQLSVMSERLDALAAENAELKRSQARTGTGVAAVQARIAEVQEAASGPAVQSWSDSIRLDGDFRYRYEVIDVEDTDTRRRNRIRARANIRADLGDDVEVGFGLATGGDDPVSTNQTLGAGGSSKDIRLNLAYVNWTAADGLNLIAGKFNNPLARVGKQALIWDGDWTPEGFAMNYERDWFFANAIGAWLESDTRNSNDSFSWGAQIGVRGEVGGARLTGGLGYFSVRTKGKSTTFGDPGDPGDYFGNSAVEASGLACGSTPDTDCVYLHDYLLTEAFAEIAFDLGNWPTTVFANFLNNSDPEDNDTAWTIGTRIGKAKDRGQMQFTYLYASKEADSMLGLVTDSDLGGGGTDNKGHFFEFQYGVNKTWSVGARYFINEVDVSTANPRDYNRLMIDTQWKWK